MSRRRTTAGAGRRPRSDERAGAVRLRDLPSIALIVGATAAAFLPLLRNEFVNWDDPFTIQNNAHLAGRGLVPWAFTTLEMGHYQPMAWLAWGATREIFGVSPLAFHALSLVGHLLNCALMFLVALALMRAARLDDHAARTAAVVSTLVFSLHPLRVEAVAWASAFPYVLSLTFTLLALLAYLRYCWRLEARLFLISIFCFALSLLSRANALDLPIVLIVLDVYPLRRVVAGSGHPTLPRCDMLTPVSWTRVVAEKVPFALLAAVAAVIESSARDIPSLHDIGPAARASMALSAPFKYLARTCAPFRLTPVDLLPLQPAADWLLLVCSALAFIGITGLAWKFRARWPAFAAAWGVYLLLLFPLLGLTPSGQQETADRYMYLAGVVVSLMIGVAVATFIPRRRWRVAGVAALVCVLAVMTWRQIEWWHDSISLWTRAIDLDPRNDLATYNLAIALDNAGRVDEAIARYNDTLRLVPDHEIARSNRDKLVALKAEREGDLLARGGNLAGAIDAYSRALAADAGRAHARAARGVYLVRSGRFSEAVPDLRSAFAASPDPAVANALAFAFMQAGEFREAIHTLTVALTAHADDIEIAGNLARVLATAPDPQARQPAWALQLALGIRAKTGGKDPRVLDTLAAAYAASGQRDLARRVLEEAIGVARQRGDADLAADLMSHERSY